MAAAAPPNRGERRRTRTRAALLGAAREVFATEGIERATIQQIADTADVAKGSFYNHFESREDILRAVVAETLEGLGSALDRQVQQREPDPARVLAASLLSTLRLCLGDPTLGSFVLRTADLLEIGDSPIGARGRRDLLSARRAGRFEFDDLEVVLTALAGAAQGLLRRRLRGELDEGSDLAFVTLALRMLGLPADEAKQIAVEVGDASVAAGRRTA